MLSRQLKAVGAKGSPETWELCYSRHKHGWSTSQFNNRCRNKGPLFFIQRRGSTSHKGRTWGGHVNTLPPFVVQQGTFFFCVYM